MSQPPASGDLNSDLVTLTFDLLTVELGCNVSRGADNLPFPPILVFTRLRFVELWANWRRDVTLTFDPWGHRACRWCGLSYFPVLIFTDVSGHCWIVFGQARATVMRATRNGVSPTTNYVTVEKLRQCHTSSTLVHWPSLTTVYCAYMKQMRLPSTGWQHMALSTQ